MVEISSGRRDQESRSAPSPPAKLRAIPPSVPLQPDPAFKGKVAETFANSTPNYPEPVKAPEGSPNVLLILLDDVGFGMCSTFGGPVETPNMEKLAKNGLTYNRFHTTALCSPTRAALLAGRNHHSVGTGVIIEMGTGYPGYTGIIPKETALISQILRDNGFATSMFGKWHNTPEGDISPAGPFDRWPTGLGFDYFYGFNQGEAHHFYPTLYRNTVAVEAPKTPEEGYHLTTDMTDEAINVPETGADGVIACAGAFSAGWTLYVTDGKPTFHYNAFELATSTIAGNASVQGDALAIGIRYAVHPWRWRGGEQSRWSGFADGVGDDGSVTQQSCATEHNEYPRAIR